MTLNSHALVTPPAPTLPYELWLNILRYFELRPLKFGHIKPDAGFTARRSVLWSLCLTSHRLLDIARPLLYANIVLPLDGSNPSARRCLRLIRTASQSPRICQLVVSLAVPLQLTTNPRLWESAKSLLPLGEIHKDHKHLFQTVHLLASSTGEITTSGQRDIIQRLVALLICLLPRLQSLLIYAPFNDIVASRNLGTSLEELLGADTGSLDEEMQKLSIAQESRPTVFDRDLPNGTRRNSMGTQSPLQRLKTLQLLQDCTFIQPGSGDGGLGPGDGLSAILPILKVRSGRLDRLDLSEYYLQDMNSSQAAGHAIAKIKEINLINLGHPGEVTVLLRAATTLDTLSLSLSQHVDSTQSSLPPPTTVVNDDYNNAILARRDSLRSLSFTAPDFDPLELGYLLGPLGRLTCLAQLDGLQFLRVEPQLLIDWLEVNTWPRFMDNLPKNLATLAFRFRTSNEDMSHVWARSGLGAALASGDKWRKKLPFLQVIVLEPLPYSTRVTDELAEGLRLHGISLTWVHEV